MDPYTKWLISFGNAKEKEWNDYIKKIGDKHEKDYNEWFDAFGDAKQKEWDKYMARRDKQFNGDLDKSAKK